MHLHRRINEDGCQSLRILIRLLAALHTPLKKVHCTSRELQPG